MLSMTTVAVFVACREPNLRQIRHSEPSSFSSFCEIQFFFIFTYGRLSLSIFAFWCLTCSHHVACMSRVQQGLDLGQGSFWGAISITAKIQVNLLVHPRPQTSQPHYHFPKIR